MKKNKKKEESEQIIKKLQEILKNLSKKEITLIESFDRQYKALEKLHSKLNNPELFLQLITINALMSYQLQMKGEKYWETFGEFFSKEPSLNSFQKFIKSYNRRFLNAKLKRLDKVIKCTDLLFKKNSLEELGKNLQIIVHFLANCLKQKKESKTIVFAAKMFMYGYRIAFNREVSGEKEIDIPLDSRLSKISTHREFWHNLSKNTGIPQLRLDGVIWITMGIKEEELKKLPPQLQDKMKKISDIISELIN